MLIVKSTGVDTVTNAEREEWIRNASYKELLRKWRYEPAGSPWFEGEVGVYYTKVMALKKAEVGHDAAVRASKEIDR